MLDQVRKHVPAARSMSDGRLAALLAAIGVMLYMIADKDTFWVAALVIGVWYAMRHKRGAWIGQKARIAPHVAALRRDLFERTPAPDESATPPPPVYATSNDPLVARAEALLRRVEARA